MIPALLKIVLNGAWIAAYKTFWPSLCGNNLEAFNNATPPPGTIPCLIAALVAHIASSILSRFSCNSISELAPTWTIATLPDSLANLFSFLTIIAGILVSAIVFLISLIKSFTSWVVSPTCIIVSASLDTDFKHWPNCSGCIKSISSPKSSFIIVAPVSKARSRSVSFLLIPYLVVLYSTRYCTSTTWQN